MVEEKAPEVKRPLYKIGQEVYRCGVEDKKVTERIVTILRIFEVGKGLPGARNRFLYVITGDWLVGEYSLDPIEEYKETPTEGG
jgi:hypothetical protein